MNHRKKGRKGERKGGERKNEKKERTNEERKKFTYYTLRNKVGGIFSVNRSRKNIPSKGTAWAKAAMGENFQRAGRTRRPWETWLHWSQLNPRILGGREGGNGCSLKEALSLTGGREKALESRRGVLNSASRGASPVMGGWRGQARKSRGAGGDSVAQI